MNALRTEVPFLDLNFTIENLDVHCPFPIISNRNSPWTFHRFRQLQYYEQLLWSPENNSLNNQLSRVF